MANLDTAAKRAAGLAVAGLLLVLPIPDGANANSNSQRGQLTLTYVSGTVVDVPTITPSVPRHGLSGRETSHLTGLLRRQDHWVDLLPSGPLVQTPARLGNRFRVYLTVDTVIEPPHTPHNGQRIMWRVEQDPTGGHTVTFNQFDTVGTLITAVDTTANAVSFVEAVYNDVSDRWELIGDKNSATTDHGGLTGLTDVDDHPGYVLIDGSREWDEQASDITTPATDNWVLYFKAGGLYHRDDAGTVTGPLVDATGSGGLTDAYSDITDGTTTASASGGDTFKFRSANGAITAAVQSNDATHGDNLLLTFNEGSITITVSQISDAGALASLDTITTAQINNVAVTHAKMENIASSTIVGRVTALAGDREELTATQVRTLINVEDGATADQTDAEIRAAVEAATDSNVFTDADHTNLNNQSGTNTGDQTDMSAISDTKADFNTALTDGTFMYVGDAPTTHTHDLSDVTDSGALAALDTVSATEIDDEAVTLAKMAHIATQTILGRTTAATGDVEALTAAQARGVLNVEDGSTADQSDAEIKTAYENNADTNAFTDAEKTLLGNQSGTNTGDQSDMSAISDTKADFNTALTDGTFMYVGDAPTAHTHTKSEITDFTESDYATGAEGDLAASATQPGDNISTLTNDSGFTDDQTGAEIKAAYEVELKAFTDTQFDKLAGIEAGATADQSDAEIETAYNAQVSQVSGGEITAGTETAVRRTSPADIVSFISQHETGGIADVVDDTTPQLGGNLDVNDKVIDAGAGSDIVLQLGDAIGANTLTVKDSGGSVTVWEVDSSGNVSATSFSTTGGTAITQTYSTTATTHAAMTSDDITDNTGGAPTHAVGAQPGTYNAAAIDDVISSIVTELNELRADVINLKGCFNTAVDNSQAGEQTK